jgi:DNA modification methylase
MIVNTVFDLIHGDCAEILKKIKPNSIDCCITSPPYYGLRSYTHAQNEIGKEETPDEYVNNLVKIFRDVWRVLKKRGTLWLNLGDSYASQRRGSELTQQSFSNKNPYPPIPGGNRDAKKIGLKHKDLIGIPWRVAFALQQPWTDWQIKSEAMRAWVAGIVDGEGCITILRTKSSHSESLSFLPTVQVRMCDREPLERLVDVAGSSLGKPQNPPSHKLANQRDSYQWKLVSDRAAKVIAEIYPFLTCKRKQAIVAWNHQMFRAARGNQERKAGELEREEFCKALINDLNQRKAVDLPSWMVEPRIVQEPGWYLRQDLIWHKPNPMPESVKDRCTRAHEYIFLFSKNKKYFYDYKAILEPIKEVSAIRASYGWKCDRPSTGNGVNLKKMGTRFVNPDGRNKRSVWTVPGNSSNAEEHSATFPPELIRPCILAGCPIGGTVLDPFAGTGTTGFTAIEEGRNCLLIELNENYVKSARKKILNAQPKLLPGY